MRWPNGRSRHFAQAGHTSIIAFQISDTVTRVIAAFGLQPWKCYASFMKDFHALCAEKVTNTFSVSSKISDLVIHQTRPHAHARGGRRLRCTRGVRLHQGGVGGTGRDAWRPGAFGGGRATRSRQGGVFTNLDDKDPQGGVPSFWRI